MKSILTSFQIFIIGFTIHSQNQLLNPGFEEKKESWNCFGSTISKKSYSGDNALKVDTETPQWIGAVQSFYLDTRTDSLEIAVWVKTKNIISGKESYEKAKVSIEFYDEFDTQIHGYPADVASVEGTTEWTKYKSKYKIQSDVVKIQLYVGLANCTGQAYFDDIIIISTDNEGNSLPKGKKPTFNIDDLNKKYTLNQYLEDFDFMVEKLKLHPSFDLFTSKTKMESIISINRSQISETTSLAGFRSLCRNVIAKVGCGHTTLHDSKFEIILDTMIYLPMELIVFEDHIYNSENLIFNDSIPVGSEITSINGILSSDIIKKTKNGISADAFNQSSISNSMIHNFLFHYHTAYGFSESYKVEFIHPQSNLKLTKTFNVKYYHPIETEEEEKSLEFDYIDSLNTGLLTIKDFIFYNDFKTFKSVIDSSFKVLKKNKASNLIIDLRGNPGGDPISSSYLIQHLIDKPFKYYEKNDFDYLEETVKNIKTGFKGNTYVLIDGQGFSTTGQFCSFIKGEKLGTLVGEQLGSTYTCTGNQKIYILPNTKQTLQVGQNRFSTTMNLNSYDGIQPDIKIKTELKDLLNGNDKVMNQLIELHLKK